MADETDPFNPVRPAGAYLELLDRVVPRERPAAETPVPEGTVPALFVSHGAPPLLDDPRWLDELYRWGRALPRPRGIVVVSAHWHDAPVAVATTGPDVPLTYDFGGFHPTYYQLQYRTPDATALANRVSRMLAPGTGVHRFTTRGLDHGAFIPLMAMFPEADVPVIQVSMPGLDPQSLFDLGVRLGPLREEGILLIGSGFMTHSFAVFRHPDLARHNEAFDTWAASALAGGDIDALHGFSRAPGVAVAHPTPEHYVPLLFTVGAAQRGDGELETPIDAMWFGNSTRSIQMGRSA